MFGRWSVEADSITIDYSDFSMYYRICGSVKYLYRDCVEMISWKVKVKGVKAEGIFLSGFGVNFLRKILISVINLQYQIRLL